MFDQNALDKVNNILAQNKEQLPEGPWMHEPDRVEFKHIGFDCLIQRSPGSYAWCGYVGVPKGHPYYGKDYSDIPVNVHGGVTYGEECSGHICHQIDSQDTLFWIGFDCAHAFDISPCMIGFGEKFGGKSFCFEDQIYRDLNYAMSETKKLAEQLAEV